jgi:hypothetical protein
MREVREAFVRFWPLTRGDRTWLAVIVGCVVAAALTETASILLFAQITDHALRTGSLAAFWGPAAAWLGVAVLGAFIGYLGNSLAVWTAERFVLRLRADVLRRVVVTRPIAAITRPLAARIHQPGWPAAANPARPGARVRAATIEPRTATPRLFPIWRPVVVIAAETPAWARGMPATAVLVIGALTRPNPTPSST